MSKVAELIPASSQSSKSKSAFFEKKDMSGFQQKVAGPDNFFSKPNRFPIQAKLAIGQPNDKYEQEAEAVADKVANYPSKQSSGEISHTTGEPKVQASWQVATIFPEESPPSDGRCHVFLGGRRIDHWSGTLLGFRHLYIDYYVNSSDYGVIEAGPDPPSATTGGGHSGAWVKSSTWESRGVQWEVTPTDCPAFINCLKSKTASYHSAGLPYHATDGPNSNSFAWWVLNECGINVGFLLPPYPYLGYNYWATHSMTSTAPVPVPATP